MTGSFWHQIWKDRPKLSPKKLLWCWWRQRWRSGETLNITHYIHVYFTHWSFQLWCKISETNAMHYKMALNISYIENFSLRIYLQNWLWYFYSKFQICVLRSAFIFFGQGYKTHTGWRPGYRLRFLKISAQSTQWLLKYATLLENGGDLISIAVARSNTKLTFSMTDIQKLLDRFTWNFYRKCKSIQPLCLWNNKTIKI